MQADRRGGETMPLKATRLPDPSALTALGFGGDVAESSRATGGHRKHSARNCWGHRSVLEHFVNTFICLDSILPVRFYHAAL